MATINNFKELEIWKKGIELVKIVYITTESFPDKEIYGLTSQIRRSAISVPSNIAEGFKRRYSKEFKQFLNIALGSLAELETQLIIAKELDYLDKTNRDKIIDLIEDVNRMTSGLIKKL